MVILRILFWAVAIIVPGFALAIKTDWLGCDPGAIHVPIYFFLLAFLAILSSKNRKLEERVEYLERGGEVEAEPERHDENSMAKTRFNRVGR